MTRSERVAEFERLARKAVYLLRADPRQFAGKVRARLADRNAGSRSAGEAGGGEAASGVSRTIDDAVYELRRHGCAKVLVYGDRATHDALGALVPDIAMTWVSHDADDVLQGAVLAGRAAWDGTDAVVVGGPDVKLAYQNALRELSSATTVPPVVWIGAGWEFCGSQIPLPSEADGADIFLYNHFQDWFSLKDPLLVQITAADQQRAVESRRIVAPRQTIRVDLDELLPERTGPVVVDVLTTHPTLTKGRHHRWRVCVDVRWRGSITTLHGGHDYGDPHPVESRRPLSDLDAGHVRLVLPNPKPGGSESVETVVGAATAVATRRLDVVVDEVVFEERPAPSGASGAPGVAGVYGYRLTSAGTPFWFAFGEQSGTPSLWANHELSVRIRDDRPSLTGSARQRFASLAGEGFLLHPHALPLLRGKDGIELGFSFLAANPAIRRFTGALFDASGEPLGRVTFAHDRDGVLFEQDVLAQLPDGGMRERASLLVFGPDWEGTGLDPSLLNMGGDLVARGASGDIDVTEFQSCWRNLGAKVREFPHWIAPPNAVTGRSHVLGRLRTDGGIRTGLLVAHASGRLDYRRDARVRIEAVLHDGNALSAERTLASFTGGLWWVDELLPALPAGTFGTVVVSSPDADVNVQLLSTTGDGGVSLQHLWGY